MNKCSLIINIKIAILIGVFLILYSQLFSQKPISYSYSKISSKPFDSCSKVEYLVKNSSIKKESGKLKIPFANKKPKILSDDGEMREYRYVGDIKGTVFSLVESLGPNDEEYYLFNLFTASVDTLIAQPVFSPNMKDFACLFNPGTDEQQRLQICEIKDGKVRTRAYIKSKVGVVLEYIACVNRNSLLAEDNFGNHWKLIFKIAD